MSFIGALLVGLILLDLLLLVLNRLGAGIRIVALQGVVLGVFSILAQWGAITARIVAIAVAGIVLKGFVFPYLLRRAMRDADVVREARPLIGYNFVLVCGLAMMGAAFWLNSVLPIAYEFNIPLLAPAAFMTLFTGLFVIVGRRMAVSQCLGYLVLENGIYTFGIATVGEIPALVELGMLLDAFVAVLVMGIAIYHINREFDHTDVARLRSLRG